MVALFANYIYIIPVGPFLGSPELNIEEKPVNIFF
jgi:hypothetical protein